MLYRKAIEKLHQWRNETNKKALCIVGARQVGKTTLVREFANRHYEGFLELNFINEPSAARIFAGDLTAKRLIANLTAYSKAPLPAGKSLILLDEVQECPQARTAVKFLVEDGRFDYIETGSLLGTRYQQIRSYPVGFETLFEMYPLSLEEFFLANGVQPETIDFLQECFNCGEAVPEAMHHTLSELFYAYLVVGGMPRAVQAYVDTQDISAVVAQQKDILDLYRLDITKYAAGSDKPRITNIFDAVAAQLSQKNRRFMLSALDKNARMNRYEESFKWLEDAGVVLPCYNIAAPQLPLELSTKHNLFKLYMGDTGLLCAHALGRAQFQLLQGDLSINMGSILENMMAQQLKANGFALRYFDSKRLGELDFVIPGNTAARPIEVKSGSDYTRHSALSKVLDVKEWHCEDPVVFCRSAGGKKDGIRYLPWYMVMFLKAPEIPPGSIHKIDLSGLTPPR